MAPQNREEYRHISSETLEWMLSEVRKNHDDILVMKTQRSMVSSTWGFCAGIAGSILVEFVAKSVLHL